MKRQVVTIVSLAALWGALSGCESKSANGAFVVGAAGAGVAGGAPGGAVVGNEMDARDRSDRDRVERGRASDARAADARADRGESAGPVGPSGTPDRHYGYGYRYTDTRYDADAQAVTKEQVIRWAQRGVRDDVIMDRVERSGAPIPLTARDENDLRDAGVSEDVIHAMKDTTRR